MYRLLCLIFVLILVMPIGANIAMAQNRGDQVIEVAQRQTLFDLLFGPKETTSSKPPTQTRTTTPRTTNQATPQVVAPEIIDKVEGATRLAIFGDSLAIDLAKAFERAYADDPSLLVLGKGVGSSGFVRDDFYDWNGVLAEEIAADSFDLAVIIIGINDKQAIGRARPLSDEWKTLYLERLNMFLAQLRAANKPVIWVGLPPMRSSSYSASISEISSLHRLASVAAGVEFVDIYERFVGEEGRYARRGPNLNGEDALMRKSDGIHFSSAGSDKVVFFVNQSLRIFYNGGSVRAAVADPLEGTDAVNMLRPPFQGNGQFRLLEVAGAVIPMLSDSVRAVELVLNDPALQGDNRINMEKLLLAPAGRADDFGVGVVSGENLEGEDETPVNSE